MKTIKEILQQAPRGEINIGCETLNILEGCLLKPGLSFVVSRPGAGKTTLALDITLAQALKRDKTVVIFSPEKRAVEIVERLLTKMGGEKSINSLKDCNVYIDDFENQPLNAVLHMKSLIENTCENCFVFIDFLDCLWTNGRGKKITFEEREKLSWELSELAKKRNIKLLVSNYVTKEDFESLTCGELPQYLKSVNTILLLDRQSYFLDDEFYTKSELQIIASGNTKTKIELDYNGMLRRFVRR